MVVRALENLDQQIISLKRNQITLCRGAEKLEIGNKDYLFRRWKRKKSDHLRRGQH